MKKYIKVVSSILICSLLISCNASTHLGVFTIAEPAKSEQDVNQWYLFYQDQFDAKNGDVSKPSNDYPLQATEGYDKAAKDWHEKVKKSLSYDIIGVAVIVGVVIYLKADPKRTQLSGIGIF